MPSYINGLLSSALPPELQSLVTEKAFTDRPADIEQPLAPYVHHESIYTKSLQTFFETHTVILDSENKWHYNLSNETDLQHVKQLEIDISFDALSVTSFRLRDYLAALIPQMSLLEIKFSCKSLEFDLLPFAISHIRQMIRTSPSLRSVTVTLPRITDPNVPDYTYWKWERKTTIDEITTSLAAHPVDRTPEDRRTETLVWEARDGTLFWDDQRQGDSFRRTP